VIRTAPPPNRRPPGAESNPDATRSLSTWQSPSARRPLRSCLTEHDAPRARRSTCVPERFDTFFVVAAVEHAWGARRAKQVAVARRGRTVDVQFPLLHPCRRGARQERTLLATITWTGTNGFPTACCSILTAKNFMTAPLGLGAAPTPDRNRVQGSRCAASTCLVIDEPAIFLQGQSHPG